MKGQSLFQLWPLNSTSQAYTFEEIGKFFYKEIEWLQKKDLQIKTFVITKYRISPDNLTL